MKGMTVIVKKISQLMVPSIFLLGLYVVVHGHLTPGGGFAGGVLLVGCFVLQILAYGSDEVRNDLKKWRASLSESIGIVLFLFIALLGLFQGGVFFYNTIARAHPGSALDLFSAGLIPLSNLAIGIEVAAALFAIFLTLAVFRMEKHT
ncbi:cation:proton antiporter [bacterium]|nr:cation:proton antiporter [bacterium]